MRIVASAKQWIQEPQKNAPESHRDWSFSAFPRLSANGRHRRRMGDTDFGTGEE
jgi:hypothetical protein